MANFVDKNPIGQGDPIDYPQECVSPKIEELDPPQIKAKDVRNEDRNDKEPRVYYVNSEGLRLYHRYFHQPTYPIMMLQSGEHYEEGTLVQYTSFL